MFGTTLRSWIRRSGVADCLDRPVSGHRRSWPPQRRDIVQLGTRADGTQTRWTHEITADSFHWLGEALNRVTRSGRSKASFVRGDRNPIVDSKSEKRLR